MAPSSTRSPVSERWRRHRPPAGQLTASNAQTREKANGKGDGEDTDASNHWHPKTDKRTGRTYYYNKATRKTVWKLPPGAVVVERGRRRDSGREREGTDGGQNSEPAHAAPRGSARRTASAQSSPMGEHGTASSGGGDAASAPASGDTPPASADAPSTGGTVDDGAPVPAEAGHQRASLTRIASRRSSMATLTKIATSRRSSASAGRRGSAAAAPSPLLERSTDGSGTTITNPSVVAEKRRASMSGSAADAAARATAEVGEDNSGAAGEAGASSGTGVNAMAGPRSGGALWRAGIGAASEMVGDQRFKGLLDLAKNPERMQAVREDIEKKEKDDGKLHFRKCKYRCARSAPSPAQ